jgi:hypothetical protein
MAQQRGAVPPTTTRAHRGEDVKWTIIKLITTYYKTKRSWNQKSSEHSKGLRTELTRMTEEELLAYAKGTFFDARNVEDIFSTANSGNITNAKRKTEERTWSVQSAEA